jgi:hypothetical protein
MKISDSNRSIKINKAKPKGIQKPEETLLDSKFLPYDMGGEGPKTKDLTDENFYVFGPAEQNQTPKPYLTSTDQHPIQEDDNEGEDENIKKDMIPIDEKYENLGGDMDLLNDF